jgi:hypothetical protein
MAEHKNIMFIIQKDIPNIMRQRCNRRIKRDKSGQHFSSLINIFHRHKKEKTFRGSNLDTYILNLMDGGNYI